MTALGMNLSDGCITAMRRLATAVIGFSIAVVASGCSYFDSGESATRFDDVDCDTSDFPRIVQQPMSAIVDEGDFARFTVAAIGRDPFSFSWHVRDVTGVETGVFVGGISFDGPTLVVGPTQLSDSGNRYRVIVSNHCRRLVDSSSALLTVVASSPRIDTQPASITVTEGQTATFSVVAGGSRPLA